MIKDISFGNIAIDCIDANRLRSFYAQLLGWDCCTMYDCLALRSQSGLVILFMTADFDYEKPVWPEKPNKQQKQMHFDFQVGDLSSAVSEAESLGARKAEEQFGGKHFITMFDPEGHPFCLCVKECFAM